MAAEPVLDAVLNLYSASTFENSPTPGTGHRGRLLTVKAIDEKLPLDQRGRLQLEVITEGTETVRQMNHSLFRKLASPFLPPAEQDDVEEAIDDRPIDQIGQDILAVCLNIYGGSTCRIPKHKSLRSHFGTPTHDLPEIVTRPDEDEDPELFDLLQGDKAASSYTDPPTCSWSCPLILYTSNQNYSFKPPNVMAALIITTPCESGCPTISRRASSVTRSRRSSSVSVGSRTGLSNTLWTPGLASLPVMEESDEVGTWASPSLIYDVATVAFGKDIQGLYPGELAAITKLLAHRLRFELFARRAMEAEVLPWSDDDDLLIKEDLTSLIIHLNPTNVRIIEATLLYDTWSATTSSSEERPTPKVVVRIVDEWAVGEDNEGIWKWLLFETAVAEEPRPWMAQGVTVSGPTVAGKDGEKKASDDSGYASGGAQLSEETRRLIEETAMCGDDCPGC